MYADDAGKLDWHRENLGRVISAGFDGGGGLMVVGEVRKRIREQGGPCNQGTGGKHIVDLFVFANIGYFSFRTTKEGGVRFTGLIVENRALATMSNNRFKNTIRQRSFFSKSFRCLFNQISGWTGGGGRSVCASGRRELSESLRW